MSHLQAPSSNSREHAGPAQHLEENIHPGPPYLPQQPPLINPSSLRPDTAFTSVRSCHAEPRCIASQVAKCCVPWMASLSPKLHPYSRSQIPTLTSQYHNMVTPPSTVMAFSMAPALHTGRTTLSNRSFVCASSPSKSACRKTGTIFMNSPTPEKTDEEVLLPPEDKEAAAKKAEEARLRAAEKFVEVDEGNHVCINCGYLYEPAQGERLSGVSPGTPFEDLDELFACPVCRSPKSKFRRKPKTIAGFAENQQYGFGGNSMTAGQKNGLIFGSLVFFILILLSGYALD